MMSGPETRAKCAMLLFIANPRRSSSVATLASWSNYVLAFLCLGSGITRCYRMECRATLLATETICHCTHQESERAGVAITMPGEPVCRGSGPSGDYLWRALMAQVTCLRGTTVRCNPART